MNVRALSTAWGITVVRVMAGAILIAASYEKFSGGGFEGFAKVAAGLSLPMPETIGVFIPLLEGIGGILLVLGLGARWVAALFVVEFLVTSIVLKTPRQPPFGGWDSMRIDLMLLAASIAIVLVGPGGLALENQLPLRGSQRPTAQPQPVPAGER
jgi:putative oxidoreductase